ncbi:MAG: cbb3-type cytochrome c oxidase subunit II, partial [Rhizobiales bacterium]|nr:cbb3-type cytochrome c oxidase subunit II [Hyphomicrobiales bacterium]
EPRSVLTESVMPRYAFLTDKPLDVRLASINLTANRRVGVPYTEEMVANAAADMKAQANPDADSKALEARYPKVKVGNYDGNKEALTEMDALVAYLQMLGTLVDFSTYDETAGYR